MIDHSSEARFELREEGKSVFADYAIQDGVLILPHVEADPALRGKGAAGRLMTEVMAYARSHKLKVRPICSYAAAYLQRHPEYHDLLD